MIDPDYTVEDEREAREARMKTRRSYRAGVSPDLARVSGALRCGPVVRDEERTLVPSLQQIVAYGLKHIPRPARKVR